MIWAGNRQPIATSKSGERDDKFEGWLMPFFA